MRHQLALEIPHVNNIRILKVKDFSVYADGLAKDCARLEVTVPGFSQSVAIDMVPGFDMNLTSCHLGLQSSGCDQNTFTIPDGLYVIRYSLSPNDKVLVEYNHLRMSQTYNKLYANYAALELSGCEPDADKKAKLRDLSLIRGYLDAAKAKIEYAHEPTKGMELFVYAQKLLTKYGKC